MKDQVGVTLMSLLVGLLIAMICMIGLLSAYRVTAKVGAESRIAATHDTQLQTGLTIAPMFLQNAGFGLEGTNHLSQTSITVESQNVTALLWRYKDDSQNDSQVVCRGLADIASADHKGRRFVLLQGTVSGTGTSCDDSQNLNAFTWKVKNILAKLSDYSNDKSNPSQIQFTQTNQACTPFGVGIVEESVQHPLITISGQTSTQKVAGLETIQMPVCLLNIQSS